jgi:hypothetical protein
MRTYGQYCPVAKAAEMLADRRRAPLGGHRNLLPPFAFRRV